MENIKRLKRKNRKRTTKSWSKFIITHLRFMVDYKNHNDTNKEFEVNHLRILIDTFIKSYNKDD